ncbi:hypothetical protein ZWY2020_057001 [Hordeum vulgare]|nr:hypothetical protein ZWY2020_057001 [Hordeum vulgare]
MYWEQLEIHCKLLGGFNLSDYFPILARLDMVTAKAMKLKRTWDDLPDASSTSTPLEQDVKDDEEEDFIDMLLSVQQEYGLTRDNIKAILVAFP